MIGWLVNILEIANRTYVEEQNELQRTILSKYNKHVRPVLNISEAVDVAVHAYIMHISVNQLEQTITLNGHIYMVLLRLIVQQINFFRVFLPEIEIN